jgi:hypothetical protein
MTVGQFCRFSIEGRSLVIARLPSCLRDYDNMVDEIRKTICSELGMKKIPATSTLEHPSYRYPFNCVPLHIEIGAAAEALLEELQAYLGTPP